MSTITRRMSLTLTKEIEELAEQTKREQYFNVPYAEMMREALAIGLHPAKAGFFFVWDLR